MVVAPAALPMPNPYPHSPHPTPAPWKTRLAQWDMSHNAIPLALFAYTSVFQAFAVTDTPFDIPSSVWYTFYIISLTSLILSITLTVTRRILHPTGVKKDFHNPRLVNFFFLPSIIGPIALISAPPFMRSFNVSLAGFYILLTYQTLLALHQFGEWLFKHPPTSSIYPLVFMQTIGFFLLSILSSTLNLPEQATATLAIGTLLWLLVFITNFQHVSNTLQQKNENPAPTFFLFIAPPAQAVIAVIFLQHAESNPTEDFLDVGSISQFPDLANGFLYIDFFLYVLMFRLFPTWWRTKFSVQWYAYIFPLSAATCAAIWKYHVSQFMFFFAIAGIMFILATIAVAVVVGCTVWAVWTGRLPKNEVREKEFIEYWMKRNVDINFVDGVEDSMGSGEGRV